MDIKYSKQANKFLDKQNEITRQRIKVAIENLPRGDVKKLTGSPYYRLRVGTYRVLFDRQFNVIFIEKIDNRGQVYRK
jgi:hypothetical protein